MPARTSAVTGARAVHRPAPMTAVPTATSRLGDAGPAVENAERSVRF